MIAKVSKVLNLSNIATTVEYKVKEIQGPPVKKFQIKKECVIPNVHHNAKILFWNNQGKGTRSPQNFL